MAHFAWYVSHDYFLENLFECKSNDHTVVCIMLLVRTGYNFMSKKCKLSFQLSPFWMFLPRRQDLASSLKIPFLETSAKSSDNVERAFLTMASEIHKRLASEGGGIHGVSMQARGQNTKINSAPVWLGGDKQTPEASNCC